MKNKKILKKLLISTSVLGIGASTAVSVISCGKHSDTLSWSEFQSKVKAAKALDIVKQTLPSLWSDATADELNKETVVFDHDNKQATVDIIRTISGHEINAKTASFMIKYSPDKAYSIKQWTCSQKPIVGDTWNYFKQEVKTTKPRYIIDNSKLENFPYTSTSDLEIRNLVVDENSNQISLSILNVNGGATMMASFKIIWNPENKYSTSTWIVTQKATNDDNILWVSFVKTAETEKLIDVVNTTTPDGWTNVLASQLSADTYKVNIAYEEASYWHLSMHITLKQAGKDDKTVNFYVQFGEDRFYFLKDWRHGEFPPSLK